MCGRPFRSPARTAVTFHGPLPTPELRNIVTNEQTVEVWNYLPGVTAEITDAAGRTKWKGILSDGTYTPIRLSTPIDPGVDLQVSMELCPGQRVTSSPQPPVDCAQLEPPRITSPRAGDTSVSVTASHPGAVIEVFAVSGGLLGRGVAPVVSLSRPLVHGEQVVLVQETAAGCRSRSGRAYAVPNPLPIPDRDQWSASLSLDVVVATMNLVPAIFDLRVFEPTQNPRGQSINLQLVGFPGALAGPAMLGRPINAFAIYDADGDGRSSRLAEDCTRARGGPLVRGPIPMFEPDALELVCTGADYQPGANLVLIMEFARTAGAEQPSQFLAIHARYDRGQLYLISAHGGDMGRGTLRGGRVMYLMDPSDDFGPFQFSLALPSSGGTGRFEARFQSLRLREFRANRTFVAELRAVLSGQVDVPVFAD